MGTPFEVSAFYASIMQGGAHRHDELTGELVEWWEDLWQRGMTSRIVLIALPPGWGRSVVLNRLAGTVDADQAPITLVVRVNGRELPDGKGLQAAALRECLAKAMNSHRVAKLLGMDRLGGSVQMGIGVGSLFVSGLAAAAGFLVTGVALAAAGKAWDDSPAGQDGMVARAARAVAATSTQVPVVVLIDDADCLEEDLALALIENLVARHGGHVLIVAVVTPDSVVKLALVDRARMGITEGRLHVADADPDMSLGAREDLARELCPDLPDAGVRRIGRGTVTFNDVLAIAGAPLLAEISADDKEGDIHAAVDTVLAARLGMTEPSAEAVAIAWAGGLLQARQAARAVEVLGAVPALDGDRDVLRWEELERLADPASPRLAAKVAALARAERRAMATALLDEALAIATDPDCGLVGRVVAAQAVHRVRDDLADRALLPGVQRVLATGLEQLDEILAARDAAVAALDEWPSGGDSGDRDWLAAAVLRLSRLAPQPPLSPDAARLISEAVATGAATGLEARIWAAVSMLDDPGQRHAALAMADQAAGDLDAHAEVLGEAGTRWRLLLAFHVGRAGHPAMTAQILSPLLNSGHRGRLDAASAVLHASTGLRADTRLQAIILEAELASLRADADDDRLRIHRALAANYATLGQYRQALAHGQHELRLRERVQGPDYPATLAIRYHIAEWTFQAGDPQEALQLGQALLIDRERVLGPKHPDTLVTRNSIAVWTGECGNATGALHLLRGLISDLEQVRGPYHPATLTTRSNIAFWTGQCGNATGALRLFLALLPHLERVFGPESPDTLRARNNIAALTWRSGDATGALRLFQQLLPDRERVLGPDHPETLSTRNNIGILIGETGDAAGALRLLQALLPDLERVHGLNHPATLTTRSSIAAWTGECGDAAGAVRLSRAVLLDLERLLGPGHPVSLSARNNVATWTGRAGDPAGAVRLFEALLRDYERALGKDHPETLTTRRSIAVWSRVANKRPGSAGQLGKQ
jgi:tetratricopeptide (TPR) repeat protein